MSNNQKVFLATTALEEFWDKDEKIVFLGEWCKRFTKKESWEEIDYIVMPSIWADIEEHKGAREYINQLYPKLLDELTNLLNEIHECEHTTYYWEMIIGYWLNTYVASAYDKYCCLKSFINLHPNFITYFLDEQDFIVMTETIVGKEKIMTDQYNLQMYTEILKNLGYQFETREVKVQTLQYERFSNIKRKLSRTIIRNLLQMLIKVFGKFIKNKIHHKLKKSNIIFLANILTTLQEIKLSISRKIAILFFNEISVAQPTNYEFIDEELRKMMKLKYVYNNEFEEMLCELIVNNLPINIVEKYKYIEKLSAEKYSYEPQIIVGLTAYNADEINVWMAKSQEKGTKIIGVQHGFNYSMEDFLRDVELPLVDGYVTWGYDLDYINNDYRDKSKICIKIAMPMIKHKKKKYNPIYKKVLYISTNWERYLQGGFFYRMTVDFQEYLKDQLVFMKSLNRQVYGNVCYRARPMDEQGWDVKERMIQVYPDIEIDGLTQLIYDSIIQTRICIIDNISTCFIEALYINWPVIIFFREENYYLLEKAKPYLDMLEEVQILHKTPESAAELLNNIYDDVYEWWFEPKRQEAIKIFLNQFGHVPNKPFRLLKRELFNITRKL